MTTPLPVAGGAPRLTTGPFASRRSRTGPWIRSTGHGTRIATSIGSLPARVRARRADDDGILGLRPRVSLRGAPVTMAYLLALAATTLTLSGAHPRIAYWMTADASTNLHNMTSQPVRVLITSAFWVESPWLIWPMAALILLIMAPAERALGGTRTVLAFAAGHVGATAITVVAIAGGIALGLLPGSLARAVDVGPSYGLAALAGLLIARLPHRRGRQLAAGLLLAGLAAATVIGDDFTDAGHLVAAALGLVLARRLWTALPVALPHSRRDARAGAADRVELRPRVTR